MAEDWSKRLQALAKKGGEDLGELCKAVKIELFSGIVSDTRVGDPTNWKSKPPPGYVGGRLRANWQIQDGSPSKSVTDEVDPSGASANTRIKAKATAQGITYFTNNLPYAKVWEDNDAMIGRNVARIRQILKKKAREIKG